MATTIIDGITEHLVLSADSKHRRSYTVTEGGVAVDVSSGYTFGLSIFDPRAKHTDVETLTIGDGLEFDDDGTDGIVNALYPMRS